MAKIGTGCVVSHRLCRSHLNKRIMAENGIGYAILHKLCRFHFDKSFYAKDGTCYARTQLQGLLNKQSSIDLTQSKGQN